MAFPFWIVQLIAAGLETTVPVPPDPPAILSGQLVAGVAKTPTTFRACSMLTWHVSGLSDAAVQPIQDSSLAPRPGLAVIVTTVPAWYDWMQRPVRIATPAPAPMLQLIPGRSEMRVPPAVLPAPLTSSIIAESPA
jgi:hypothetical protein